MKIYKILFVIASIILVVTNIICIRACSDQKKENDVLEEQLKTATENGKIIPTRVIETVYDTMNNTSTTTILPVQTTSAVSNFVSKGMADTLAMALKVAVNKIDRLESKVIELRASGKGERSFDSISKSEWLVMNDPTFDVRVNLNNDSVYPSARLKLMQAYAPYRKNIFSRTEYRSVIRVNDARVHITDIQSINKVPKSPRWGISAFAGPFVHPQGINYGFGLGLTYDLIQF